jgi:hypothetical protein
MLSLFHQQMKNFCEKHQHREWRAVFVGVWSLNLSQLSLDLQKDEYLCSFLEVVPKLVICHLLQPVVRLLPRLAVAVPLLLPKNSLQHH